VIATSGPSPHQQIAALIRTRESSSSVLENSSVFSLNSIFHPCTRVVKFDKRYYSHASNASSKFIKEVVNKLVARTKMKIKLAVAAVVVLGGLASLVYAQRSSAICPMHGVSGSPTGAPINDKGQCEYQHSMDGGDSIHRFRASCYY
jgi:hypothetical protein